MASAAASLQSSAGSKQRVLHYLSAKGGYRNIEQISKQVASDPADAEHVTRELLSLGLVKQSSRSGDQSSFKISFKGELAAASFLHMSLFILIGIVTLVGGIASLSSLLVAGVLIAVSLGLFGYIFLILKARRLMK